MDIAALLLWMVTVASGVYLLAAGRAARGPVGPAPAPATESGSAAQGTGIPQAVGGAPQAVGGAQAGVPQAAATAYAAGAAVPPITHTRITTRPGEHPLLEFMHPALGLIGLGCWIAFVLTRFSAFAWAALGVIAVTITAGVSWYTVNTRAVRAARAGREPGAAGDGTPEPGTAEPGAAGDGTTAEPGAAGEDTRGPALRYRARRLLVHGSGAALTFVLALVTALAAHHA